MLAWSMDAEMRYHVLTDSANGEELAKFRLYEPDDDEPTHKIRFTFGERVYLPRSYSVDQVKEYVLIMLAVCYENRLKKIGRALDGKD